MPEGKRPIEQEAVKTTIVGGRPPGSGKPVGPIPRGIEVLIKKAAVDPEFKAILLEKRADAAREIGLALDPAEAMMLKAAPANQLEAIIARTTVAPSVRSAFLGRAAAVMLVALGAGTVGCTGQPPSSAGDVPDRPTAKQTVEPAKPAAETPKAEPAPAPPSAESKPAVPPSEAKPTGIPTDRPPAKEAAPPTETAKPHTNMPWAGVAPVVPQPPGPAPSLPDRPPAAGPKGTAGDPGAALILAAPDEPAPQPPPPGPPAPTGIRPDRPPTTKGVQPDRPPTEQPAPPDTVKPAPPDAPSPAPPPPAPPPSVGGVRPDRPPTPAPPDANAPAPAPPSATEPSPKPDPSPPVSRGIRPDRPTVKPEAAPANDQRPGQPPTAGRGGSRPDRPAPNPEPKPDDTQ
jgi:hypothetical protein